MLFVEIAGSGDLKKLIIKGKASLEKLTIAWEELILNNSNATGNREYNNYTEDIRDYGKLVQSYLLAKAHLMKLLLVIDAESIKFLNIKGFRISTDTHQKFVESIERALKRNESWITRINLKQNELNGYKDDNKQTNLSAEQLIAQLSFQLGFALPSTLTLAAYNEYYKVLRTSKRKEDDR